MEEGESGKVDLEEFHHEVGATRKGNKKGKRKRRQRVKQKAGGALFFEKAHTDMTLVMVELAQFDLLCPGKDSATM